VWVRRVSNPKAGGVRGARVKGQNFDIGGLRRAESGSKGKNQVDFGKTDQAIGKRRKGRGKKTKGDCSEEARPSEEKNGCSGKRPALDTKGKT